MQQIQETEDQATKKILKLLKAMKLVWPDPSLTELDKIQRAIDGFIQKYPNKRKFISPYMKLACPVCRDFPLLKYDKDEDTFSCLDNHQFRRDAWGKGIRINNSNKIRNKNHPRYI